MWLWLPSPKPYILSLGCSDKQPKSSDHRIVRTVCVCVAHTAVPFGHQKRGLDSTSRLLGINPRIVLIYSIKIDISLPKII